MLLEAYSPEQLEFKTGGPPVAEMMMTLEDLENEFQDLQFEHKQSLIRDFVEGKHHTGKGAVVQIIARNPVS